MSSEETTETIIKTIQMVQIADESEDIKTSEKNISEEKKILLNDSLQPKSKFYTDAKKYWSEVPATIDGMLGGFGFISSIDIKGSIDFMNGLIKDNLLSETAHALDCGAGIGRVSKNFLMKYFDKVDLVEQDSAFSKTALDYCKGVHLGSIYNTGLQEFNPDLNKYNLVWSQWVLGHLTDEDLLSFFKRIKKGLNKNNGVFVIKENVTSTNKTEVDETDSSVTRPLKKYERILKKAQLQVVKTSQQFDLPKGLYQVYMLACRPINK